MNKKHKLGYSFFLCAILLNSLNAKETHSLDDLTVTANKVEENIQEIPMSISAFDEFSIEDKNILDLEDISRFTPNFLLNNDNDWGFYSPSIRGISSSGTITSSTVGLYLDGVPVTNLGGFNTLLEDAQRVEVLRGPQSTLYGKGAHAGAINVITKKPGNHTEGKVGIEYGSDNKQQLSGTISTPIIENKLFLGLTGRYYSKDGFIKSDLTGKTVDDRKNYYGRIYLRATPNENLELSLISSRYKEDSDGIRRNSITAKDSRVFYGDANNKIKSSDELHSFKAIYNAENFNIESITSYKKYIQNSTDSEIDYTPSKIFHVSSNVPYKTLSQELRFNGTINSLNWLIGFIGSKNEQTGGWSSESIIPTQNGTYNTDIEEKNLGVFTHLNYELNDKINLITGLGYNKDKNKIDDYSLNYSDSKNSNNLSPKFAIEYKINKNLMSYINVAKGYKNGGFYMYAPANYSKYYDNETLWNYELGLKSDFLDGDLILNASIYYMDIKDMQVLTQIDNLQSYVSNAASATSKGFELETNYRLNNNLSLFASFGFNKTVFDKFSDSDGDYSGKYNPFAPKFTYSFGTSYRADNGFFVSGNITGYGKMYLNKANTFERKPYSLVNAKVGYEWDNNELSFYANNLFDKNYDLVGYYERYIDLKPPREIGVKYTYRF